MIGDLVKGFSHRNMSWNIVDVRDVAEAQRRIAESTARLSRVHRGRNQAGERNRRAIVL